MNSSKSLQAGEEGRDGPAGLVVSPAASETTLPEVESALGRLLKLLLIGSAVALALLGLYLTPSAFTFAWSNFRWLLPTWLRQGLETSGWFLAAAIVAIPLTRRPRRVGPLSIPEGLWTGLDAGATWTSRIGLPALLAAAALVLLAGWIPHYLTWPWWTDTEYFAVTAQAWSAGILPYRDLYDFNFPGPTYLHWLLGRVFGWGRPVAFQAFDAALLATLGLILASWSRARFGGAAPGLLGYLAALFYYLMLDYSLAGQRDWQAPLCVLLAILSLEVWRGDLSLAASGLLFALALSFRPHPVVLLPALLSAIEEHARPAGGSWKKVARDVTLWSGVVAAGLIAAAAPVLLAGVADDFAHWFRLAWYGGQYGQHQAGSRSKAAEFISQLIETPTAVVLSALVVVALVGRPHRRLARTWALGLLGVLLYKPLSPIAHDYLTHPKVLVWSAALATLIGWAWTSPRVVPSVRVLLVVVILCHIGPWRPAQWQVRASLDAIVDLALRRDPENPPPGCSRALRSKSSDFYTWDDYRRVLDFLRTRTTPRTRVAGFFRSHPFPTVNGPVGRLPLFPSPGGVLWLRFAAPGLEGPFVEALGRFDDAVVVWTPGLKPEPRMQLKEIEAAVRRLYEPETRFGKIEVWRRKPAPRESGPEESGVQGETTS